MIEIRVSPEDEPIHADGPHDHEGTRAIAAGIDSAFRLLNYATSPEKHGLTYPSDVYSVLGELSAPLGKFPQSLRQMTQFIAGQVAEGQVRENPGYGNHGGDAEAACAELEAATQRGSIFATELARLLDKAQSAVRALEAAEEA